MIEMNVTWDSLAGKPSAFTPTAHSHTIGDITGFGTGVATALAIAAGGAGGLVRNSDLKTVNGNALVGVGDIAISGYSLPSMTGQSGKFLTNNGTVESWSNAFNGTLGATTPASVASTGVTVYGPASLPAILFDGRWSSDPTKRVVQIRVDSSGNGDLSLNRSVDTNGTIWASATTGVVQVASGGGFYFSDTANATTGNAASLTLTRQSAGIAQLGTTGANALGSLLLTNLTASGTLSIGTTPATAGAVRLANSGTVSARNLANTANVDLVQLNSSNIVQVGGPSNAVSLNTFWMTNIGTGALNATSANFPLSFGNAAFLYGPAANTLEQRNSTNAQALNLYGTYTDVSNYRRLRFGSTTAGAFSITAEGLGTGASGNTLTVVSPNFSVTSGGQIYGNGGFFPQAGTANGLNLVPNRLGWRFANFEGMGLTVSNTAGTPGFEITTTAATAFASMLNVKSSVATAVALRLIGAASQTADLQQWQNSAGTILASVSASGTVTSTGMIQTSSDIVFMPSSTITPTLNTQVTIERTSNTSLTFKLKGTDGTVRTGVLTLS